MDAAADDDRRRHAARRWPPLPPIPRSLTSSDGPSSRASPCSRRLRSSTLPWIGRNELRRLVSAAIRAGSGSACTWPISTQQDRSTCWRDCRSRHRRRQDKRRSFAIAALVVIAPAFWLTGSRAAFVATLAGFLILAVVRQQKSPTRVQLVAATAALMLVIAGAFTVDWQSECGSAAVPPGCGRSSCRPVHACLRRRLCLEWNRQVLRSIGGVHACRFAGDLRQRERT